MGGVEGKRERERLDEGMEEERFRGNVKRPELTILATPRPSEND